MFENPLIPEWSYTTVVRPVFGAALGTKAINADRFS